MVKNWFTLFLTQYFDYSKQVIIELLKVFKYYGTEQTISKIKFLSE